MLLTQRAENVFEHSILKIPCSRPAARINEHCDRKARMCVRINRGGEVVPGPLPL